MSRATSSAARDNLDEVWPTGYYFEGCGLAGDGVYALATPGIVSTPPAPVVYFEGDYFYDYYPDSAGQLVLTISAGPGYVIVLSDNSGFVPNGDGSYTTTLKFEDQPC